MSDILSPSRLLPATIMMTTAALGIKVIALATAVPSVNDWRAGTQQVLELASTARMIGRAYAGTGQAAENAPSLPAASSAASGAKAPPLAPMPLAALGQGGEAPQTAAGQVATQPPGPQPAVIQPSGTQASGTQASGTQAPGLQQPGTVASELVPAASSQAAVPQAAPSPIRAVDADVGLPARPGRSQLEEREKRLAEREATVAAVETHLTDRVAELQAIQTRLETLEAERKVQEEANWAGLVRLYEGMRPRDAAVIFNALDKPVLLEIVDRMKPAKAAPVLALMEPESARQVTADLAAKRTRSVTAAN
jgi:flagellar motility protein MotE (MotC chaperone)